MKEIDENLSQSCQEAIDELTAKLMDNNCSEEDLNILCLQHEDCEDILRKTFKTWHDLDAFGLPNSSGGRTDRFYQMLSDFEDEHDDKTDIKKISGYINVLKWAAVFVFGLALGVLITDYGDTSTIAKKEDPVLNALVSSSTSERLTALQTIKSTKNPKQQVYEALYQTLTNDPNVNVRLSTVEAMVHFADQPEVRALLIKALSKQESPIVQLMLADVIIKLQEEGAIEELKELMESGAMDSEVKFHVRESLNML